MSITEKLANLSIPAVLITVAILLVLRYVLLKQKSPVAKSIAEIAESLAVAMALVFLLIKPFVVQAFYIPSPSMHPTLLENDHILVNKFVYRVGEPKRGDVVVFKAPPEASPDVEMAVEDEAAQRGLQGRERKEFIARESKAREKDYIKRVIAIPGDTVRITQGYVLIGDQQFNHSDLRNNLTEPGSDSSVKLVDGKVLVGGKAISSEHVASDVGLPDAKVKVVPSKVYINGKAIKEPYIAEDPDASYPSLQTIEEHPEWIVVDKKGNKLVKIPKGRLLVMGDNRNNSNDARFWGLLDRKRLLGKAMFIFWPLNRIRWIH